MVPATLAQELEDTFPSQYSELNRNKIARNTASSWTQSGHLAGRTNKIRQRITPTAAAVTMALFLGTITGYYGSAVFSNPWCRLLDLNAERARALGQEAHRAGLLNLRAVGLAVSGGLNLGGSLETIFNPVVVVETAIEKGAASILMPISSRRQLNDLPDDLAAKITIHYYLDARDALLKALAI